jgi:hypothetical protein
LTHVLVEQHPDQQGERVAGEQAAPRQRSRRPTSEDIRCLMTP